MKDKLKSCPFCGGKAQIVEEHSGLGCTTYHIQCQNKIECPLHYARTKRFYKKSEAVEAWNRRVENER